jgi:hypothetical protein
MSKYAVLVCYEVGGKTSIEAESGEEAKKKVKEKMDYDGIDSLALDVKHRDYFVIDSEKED